MCTLKGKAPVFIPHACFRKAKPRYGVGAVTSVCRYFFFFFFCFQRAARGNLASGLRFPNFSHIFPSPPHIHLLGETCYFHPFFYILSLSLSGLDLQSASYAGNCNKQRGVSISARSCLARFLAGLCQAELQGTTSHSSEFSRASPHP